VRFLGFRRDVPEILAGLHVFVLPSESEGFGLVVREAQAVGVPVVATDTGGLSELVRDGDTGLLVPPRDTAALAAALRRMLEDPALRRRLSEAGRREAGASGLDGYLERLGKIYRDVPGGFR
jgi:glycosyltransferase involved in cell wall biosynthesis